MKEIRVKVTEKTFEAFKSWMNDLNEDRPKVDHLTMNRVLTAFCEDITATPGAGSDERMYADQWFDRHMWF